MILLKRIRLALHKGIPRNAPRLTPRASGLEANEPHKAQKEEAAE